MQAKVEFCPFGHEVVDGECACDADTFEVIHRHYRKSAKSAPRPLAVEPEVELARFYAYLGQ